MPTVIEYPGECPLDLPAVLHDLEPLTRTLDHFQVHLVRPFEAADPVPQPLGLIATIDPELAQALDARGKIPLQQQHQTEPIIRISCGDHHGHDQPKRINQDMAFAPFDFFVPVKAHVALHKKCLLHKKAGYCTKSQKFL